MEIDAIIFYGITLFVAAIIPGPGIIAAVGKALGGSQTQALAFVTGIALGDVLFLTLAVLGLSVLANTFSEVFVVFRVIGASYLVYLAYKFWTSNDAFSPKAEKNKSSILMSAVGGFLVTMSNPKAVLFYVVLLPSIADVTTASLIDFLALTLATFICVTLGVVPYVLFAAKTRSVFKGGTPYKIITRGASGVLLATAGFITFRQT